jgi:hypothetical protein
MDRRFLLLFFKKEALPSLRLSRPPSKIRTAHRRLRIAQAGGAEPLLPSLRVFTVTMKLSARNQIKGTVTAVTKGQTTGHVQIDVGHGLPHRSPTRRSTSWRLRSVMKRSR